MSLLNDMLRDLDRRHGGAGAVLPDAVRPLPPERARSIVLPGLLVAAFGTLAVAAWLFVGRQPPIPSATVVPAVLPRDAAIGAKEPAPAAAVPTAESAQDGDVAAVPGGLRLDASLSTVSPVASPGERPDAGAATESAQPAVARPVLPARAEKLATQRPEPAERKPKLTEPAYAASSVEKRPAAETPKERTGQDYLRAHSLLAKGRTEEAMPLLRGVLAAEASHEPARLALIGALSLSGRHEEALALVGEGLKLDPMRPALALAAARLLVVKGDANGAVQVLARTAPAARTDAEYRAFHAAVLQRLTFHKEAVTEYQEALRLAPRAGIWWLGLGISLEEENRTAEAREAYQKARASGTLATDLEQFVARKLMQLQ